MIATDESALICDLAETYGIFGYKRVPVKTLGILATGLGHNSRIMLKLSEQNYDLNTMLLASIADSLHNIIYIFSGDKNTEPPESYVEALTNNESEKRSQYETFETASDFEKRRNELVRKIKENDS